MSLRWTAVFVACLVWESRCLAEGSSYAADYAIIEGRINAVLYHSSPDKRLEDSDPLLKPDGSFKDLDYDRNGQSEEMLTHAARLDDMIRRDLVGNALKPLKAKTIRCFNYLTYKVPNATSINFWLHVIGIPTKVWPVIFRLRNHFSEKIKSDFMNKFFTKAKFGPVWNPTLKSGQNSGANLAPRLRTSLVEYFLKKKLPEFHEEAKAVLRVEYVDRNPFKGDGMRQDGCLHQHSKKFEKPNADGTTQTVVLGQIYNNNYGKEIMKHLPVTMWQVDGTAFDFGEEIEEGIFSSFLDCHQWLYRGTTVEPASVGRFMDSGKVITRTGGKQGVLEPLKYLEKINRHQASITAARHRYHNFRPDLTYALQGNRHFYVSDLMAHHRQDFMATLRLLSPRTVRPETIPPSGASATFYKGNAEGYFMGDGFLTTLVTGKELGSFEKEVFQLYDWTRVPGATLQYTNRIPQVSTTGGQVDKRHSYNDGDFSGGVSNKKEGLAVLDYARPTVALTAKKSWFFFDNIIFCLGSDISLPPKNVTEYKVTTTLNQVIYEETHMVGDVSEEHEHSFLEAVEGKLSQSYDLTEGLWFHHGSIGYVPIISMGKIKLEVEKKDFVIKKGTTTAKKFSLWMDHGSAPSMSMYAYAVLPAHSVAQTKEFSNEHTATILSLDSSRHAACFKPLEILGIVFFSKKCMFTSTCLPKTGLKSICTDEPALVMLKDIGNAPPDKVNCPDGVKPFKVSSDNAISPTLSQTLQISIADPTQKLSKINLKFTNGEKNLFLPIVLPPPPKAGDSLIMCLSLT